jgi:hypothetical protein
MLTNSGTADPLAQAWAASIRRARHIGDFTRWKDQRSYRKAFQRLLRDLKSEQAMEAEA